MRRGSFGTRWGFYFAAIGAAFGLGSLWRFPYIVADNGGGGFVFLYVFLVMLLGLPLLLTELFLGKFSRRSVISAFRQLRAQHASTTGRSRLLQISHFSGHFSLVICVCILAYYSVICGWVMHFFIQFASAALMGNSENLANTMGQLNSMGWLQILLASGHLTLVILVVLKGVEDGIEKAVGYLIPIFVAIVLVLVTRSLQLDTRDEALRYFLYPDFSKLKWSSLGAAIGHFCFTLSIGFSSMVTFGSYLQDSAKVPATGFRVVLIDSVGAIIACLLVFPLVVGGQSANISGPELLFQTVPEFFMNIEGGILFGVFFFLCLYIASLGASISLLEAVVANLQDSFRMNRAKATWGSGVLVIALSAIPALSSSLFADLSFFGHSLLDSTDRLLINWLVPLFALFISQCVVYKLDETFMRSEFEVESDPTQAILYMHWRKLIKYVVPPIIILGLILQIF